MKKAAVSILLVLLGLSFYACMEKIDISMRPADYQWHQTSLHAKVHWGYRFDEADNVIIEGLVESWSGEVKLEDILVTAILYNPQGMVIMEKSARPQRAILNPGELTPFRLILHPPVKPTKVKLEESYKPIRSY